MKTTSERFLDLRRYPEIWRLTVSEETVFSMLTHDFEFCPVIRKILEKSYPSKSQTRLLLSAKYLDTTRRIFPGYYSDRERIVVMLNRYLLSRNIREFIKWLPYFEDRKSAHIVRLMIGVFYLDRYLDNLYDKNLLSLTIMHLQKAFRGFKTQEGKTACGGLIAFAHYMNNEFQDSMSVLHDEDSEFNEKFLTLLKKEIA